MAYKTKNHLEDGHARSVKMRDVNRENWQAIQGKKYRFKKFYLIAIPILLLLVVLAGSGATIVVIRAKYHDDTTLAQTAIQHLQTAAHLLETLPQNPLDALTASRAQNEFSAALSSFGQLDHDVQSFSGVSAYVPVYGAKLSSVLRLIPLAIEVSQAGMVSCSILNLLISRMHDPLNAQGGGLNMTDVKVIDQDLHQVKAMLNVTIGQVNHLQPEDMQLDPRISKLVAAFHQDLPTLQKWLDNAEKLLVIAPALLGIGTPANYLIEVQDTTELRPGGGFIGNYGIATLSGGRLQSAHITDVDLLDKPFEFAGGSIPYPPAYTWFDIGGSSWSFRDSNLDADFPTAARYGELTYKEEGGNVPVQGVIAITPGLIEQALEITGSISVPEYHETVTAQNLVDRIHYYQLGAHSGSDLVPSPDGHSSLRKRFTELLAEHLLTRVRQLSSWNLGRLLRVVLSSLRTKDVQIYFNSSLAESFLQSNQLGASIQSPAGDSLFVVDSNDGASKANNLITYTLDDQVTIDAQGKAIHHTKISYAWTTQGQLFLYNLGPLYRDYMRMYVPPGSLLQTQDGLEPLGTSSAFDREVWSGLFTLSFGQTRTFTFTWTVPGAAKKDVNGWHYQYLIQRQAGVQRVLHVRVTLPSCAVVTAKEGGLASISGTRNVVTLSQPLNEDMNVGLDYTC